jgi:hypothetical protein
MLVVPLTSDPAQSFDVQLGDDKLTIEARFNDRSNSWTFDLTDANTQETLVTGVPLLIGQDMLAPYALGRGGLVATDLSSTDTDAGPDDLGDRVIVTWLSPDELSALAAAGVPGIATFQGAPAAGGTSGSSGTGGGTGGAGGGGTGGGGTGGTGGSGGGGTGGGTGGTGGTGGGTSLVAVPSVPLVLNEQHADSSGVEVLVAEWPADLTPNVAATVTLDIAFLASSATGTATYRAYVGGTVGTIDGTLVGSITRAASTLAPVTITGTIGNPRTTVLVKLTMQSSGAGSNAVIDEMTGSIG